MQLVAAREPLGPSEGTALVDALIAACVTVRGSSPALVGAPFWTDAALTAAAGIPSVVFGPTPHDIHGTEERVSVQEVEELAAILCALIDS